MTGADAPSTDQPLWQTQTTNTRSGADTWRCKECHGWDYQGVDGAYGSGSHLTGFPGVLASASLSEADLAAQLTGQANPDHDFSGVLDEDEVAALVAFIREGLLDMTVYGRQEAWEDSPEGYPQTPRAEGPTVGWRNAGPYGWWNLHDEYDQAPG